MDFYGGYERPFAVSCQKRECSAIGPECETQQAAIAAWNRRAVGEREYTREEMREACQNNYNAGRAAGGEREADTPETLKADIDTLYQQNTDLTNQVMQLEAALRLFVEELDDPCRRMPLCTWDNFSKTWVQDKDSHTVHLSSALERLARAALAGQTE